MHRKRLITTFAALVISIALVPVATAFGSDSGGPQPLRTTEAAVALGSSFTYQGKLTDGGSPANGNYDLRLILYDAESGGAQVGSIVTKTNVAVVNGLFTVDLDFGTIPAPTATATTTPTVTGTPTVTATPTAAPAISVFNGDARWMEIAVRPGGTSGTFTVLSPRQPVSPVPYAFFAKAAGGFSVPLNALGATTGNAGALDVTQSGTGIGIAGRRTSVDASAFPGVYGSNAGGGAGVQGESTFATGIGVQGFASGATGTGGKFSGPIGGTGVAIDLAEGALKVSGTNRTAFVHTASVANSSGSFTAIDSPFSNLDNTAMVIVTRVGADSTTPLIAPAVGVFYNTAGAVAVKDKWVIYSLDGVTGIPVGAKFNVLVIKQ
jgi:hypothetical protein